MKSYTLFFILAFLPLAAHTATVDQDALKARIQKDFLQFESPDWRQRMNAFEDLAYAASPGPCHEDNCFIDNIDSAIQFGAATKEEMAAHLIALLGKEAPLWNRPKPSDDYDQDYVGDLVMAVEHMRDKRALPAMMMMLARGASVDVSGYGDEALAQVAALYRKPGKGLEFEMGHMSAICTLREMAEPKNLAKFSDPAISRDAIKQLLLAGVSDRDEWVRMVAIGGLVNLGDTDVIPVLQKIADNDPFSDTHPDLGFRHQVRAEAQGAIGKLTTQKEDLKKDQ